MPLAAARPGAAPAAGSSGVAASRAWQGLDRYAPSRHDTGPTTARSVDEIALIRNTINHYGPVFIASLSIQIRRAGVQKKFGGRAAGWVRRPRCPVMSASRGKSENNCSIRDLPVLTQLIHGRSTTVVLH